MWVIFGAVVLGMVLGAFTVVTIAVIAAVTYVGRRD